MKKLLCLILAVCIVLSFAACNGAGSSQASSTDASSSEKESQAAPTPAEIEAAIAKALGEGDLATVDVPEEELFTCALGEADLTKLDSYVAKQTLVSAVDLDSIVIAKCKDEAYAEELLSQFNEKFQQVSDYAAQYPFNLPKVQATRIYRVEDTVMYILAGANPDQNASEEEA
ncbi:MAG: DUF4358 domain-containing protein, partial [Oscillospiraceae bacterium]|nr:DUF4358 domain-containing protein [Oscillospiraceae bacterium]